MIEQTAFPFRLTSIGSVGVRGERENLFNGNAKWILFSLKSLTFVINIRKLYYYFRRLMRSGMVKHIAQHRRKVATNKLSRANKEKWKSFSFYFPTEKAQQSRKTDKVKLKIVFNNFHINYIFIRKIVIQLNQIKLKNSWGGKDSLVLV